MGKQKGWMFGITKNLKIIILFNFLDNIKLSPAFLLQNIKKNKVT